MWDTDQVIQFVNVANCDWLRSADNCINDPVVVAAALQWRHNGAIASQITSLAVVYSIVYSDADQRKHLSSASLAFVWGIHRGPVNSPHKMASYAENVSIWWRHHGVTYWERIFYSKGCLHIHMTIWWYGACIKSTLVLTRWYKWNCFNYSDNNENEIYWISKYLWNGILNHCIWLRCKYR